MPVKSLGTAGPALLRDAVNSAGMGIPIPLSCAGSGHTHTHVPPSNTYTSRGTCAAADLRELVATELVGTSEGGGYREGYI